MKILSILAFAGLALGNQIEAHSHAHKGKGNEDVLGMDHTLSSEYLKKVSDTLNTVRKKAVDDEYGSADKMMKYYKNIIGKAKEQMKEIRGLNGQHPKRAIMDLNAKTKLSSQYDGNWNNPRLDGRFGVHQDRHQAGRPQVWTTLFPGGNSKTWEISKFIYKKRGDQIHGHNQFLTAIKVEYFDGKKWNSYKNGEWLPTNIKQADLNMKEHTIVLDPPIEGATQVRIHVDKDHNYNKSWFSGRYDWMIAPEN